MRQSVFILAGWTPVGQGSPAVLKATHPASPPPCGRVNNVQCQGQIEAGLTGQQEEISHLTCRLHRVLLEMALGTHWTETFSYLRMELSAKSLSAQMC
jgi:hypothetical protein